MVYKYFHKKSAGTIVAMLANKSAIKKTKLSNLELPEEPHKPSIQKPKKWIVHSSFMDNFWVDDLANMQLITKLNKRIRFLLFTFLVNMHGLFLIRTLKIKI